MKDFFPISWGKLDKVDKGFYGILIAQITQNNAYLWKILLIIVYRSIMSTIIY